MLLYVMRHGPAEDRAKSGLDDDRALTASGRERVEHVATKLHHLRSGVPLKRVVASPLKRARETADIVARVAASADTAVEVRDELCPDEPRPLGLVAELASTGMDTVIIGHHPNVERVVRALVDPRQADLGLSAGFCTAMIAVLEPTVEAQFHWKMQLLIDPRQL